MARGAAEAMGLGMRHAHAHEVKGCIFAGLLGSELLWSSGFWGSHGIKPVRYF